MKYLFVANNWDLNGPVGYDSPIPIALLDLAPLLRRKGHDVECRFLYDVDLSTKYDFVAYSTLFEDQDLVIDTMRKLRKMFPSTAIVMGGKNTRTLSSEVKVIAGELGVDYTIDSGEEYFLGGWNIDFSSYPSWDIKDMTTLRMLEAFHACNVMSSRGCPYSCNFCHNTEREITYFSVERTVDNIELLFSLGRKYVNVCDDIFTLKPERMIAIYDECVRRGINIKRRIRFFSHINHINEATGEAMKIFDPFVSVGIESGDNRMLKKMAKPFTREKALDKIALLSKYVNRIQALFLMGYPGETIESLENSLSLAEALQPYCFRFGATYYQPVRNTIGYEEAIKQGTLEPMIRRNGLNTFMYIDFNLSKQILGNYAQKIMAFNAK